MKKQRKLHSCLSQEEYQQQRLRSDVKDIPQTETELKCKLSKNLLKYC